MTKGYVQAEIDKIKGVADYNIKLTTELDTEDESKAPPAKATRKEKKKKAKKTRLSKLQHTSSVHIDEMEDEDLKEWKGRGVGLAESFNLTDLKQVLKLNKHLHQRGNSELFTTPKNGSCAFASIRRGMEAPEEFRKQPPQIYGCKVHGHQSCLLLQHPEVHHCRRIWHGQVTS